MDEKKVAYTVMNFTKCVKQMIVEKKHFNFENTFVAPCLSNSNCYFLHRTTIDYWSPKG